MQVTTSARQVCKIYKTVRSIPGDETIFKFCPHRIRTATGRWPSPWPNHLYRLLYPDTHNFINFLLRSHMKPIRTPYTQTDDAKLQYTLASSESQLHLGFRLWYLQSSFNQMMFLSIFTWCRMIRSQPNQTLSFWIWKQHLGHIEQFVSSYTL